MIIFYPRDIGIWRDTFDFHPSITLVPKEKTDHKVFRDRGELIEFCKEYGVRLDNAAEPLQFVGPKIHERFGPDTYIVMNTIVIGWMKDYYR